MELCVQKRGHDKGHSFLFPKASQGKQELGVGTYDAENMKKESANAIIMHDYPLSIVDHVGFRRYSATLCNTLNLYFLTGSNSLEEWGVLLDSRLSERASPKREGQSFSQDFIWKSRLSEKGLGWARDRSPG
ncbi:hypothetical protein Lal_00021920 [Lupinus albus]|nr:hypothetical protein Lal_00021920 [Lupinus albus]